MGNTISLYQKPAPTPVFKPDHLYLQYSNLTKEAKRIVRERWILGGHTHRLFTSNQVSISLLSTSNA